MVLKSFMRREHWLQRQWGLCRSQKYRKGGGAYVRLRARGVEPEFSDGMQVRKRRLSSSDNGERLEGPGFSCKKPCLYASASQALTRRRCRPDGAHLPRRESKTLVSAFLMIATRLIVGSEAVAADQVYDRDQDDGADRRHRKETQVAVGVDSEPHEDCLSDDRTDKTEDHVHYDSEAAPAHQFPREPSGDESDYDRSEKMMRSHIPLAFRCAASVRA